MVVENGILKVYCGDSREVLIPAGVKRIAGLETNKDMTLSKYPGTNGIYDTFRGNTQIETIYIPDGVKIIGTEAFANCRNLKSVNLPISIEEIQRNAFFNTNLTQITYAGTMAQFMSIDIVTLPAVDFTITCQDGEIFFHNKFLS